LKDIHDVILSKAIQSGTATATVDAELRRKKVAPQDGGASRNCEATVNHGDRLNDETARMILMPEISKSMISSGRAGA
jgi:hypothetical protein